MQITQSLPKYITQIRLRNYPKFCYADYANTIFITHHYAMGNLLMTTSTMMEPRLPRFGLQFKCR